MTDPIRRQTSVPAHEPTTGEPETPPAPASTATGSPPRTTQGGTRPSTALGRDPSLVVDRGGDDPARQRLQQRITPRPAGPPPGDVITTGRCIAPGSAVAEMLQRVGQQVRAEGGSLVALRTLRNDPSFCALTPRQQLQVLTVWAACTDDNTRSLLLEALHRTVNGHPVLVDPSRVAGRTALDAIEDLARQPLDPRLQARPGETPAALRNRVLDELMSEICHPASRIDQTDRGTCAATSAIIVLGEQNPGEYARVASELLRHGTARLADGREIAVPADAWPEDRRNGRTPRTPSERLVQAAVMQGGRPTETYLNTVPGRAAAEEQDGFIENSHADRDGITFRVGGSGLTDDELARIHSSLTGRPHHAITRRADGSVARGEVLTRELEQRLARGEGHVLAGMRWGSERTAKPSHEVAVFRVTADRVYFVNPWGPSGVEQNGHREVDPPVTTENHDHAIQSIARRDFDMRVDGLVVPDQLAPPAAVPTPRADPPTR